MSEFTEAPKVKFTWDARKAASNLRKHKLSFGEASTVFTDASSVTIPDTDHSVGENRFVTLGVSSSNRVLVVCHTDSDETIRIISARSATRHEKASYES